MRQWKEIQKMSRRQRVIGAGLLLATCHFADDQAVWREFGLADTQVVQAGTRKITAYRMKDPTGALAAWQWQRSADEHACEVSAVLRAGQNANADQRRELLAGDGWPTAYTDATRHINGRRCRTNAIHHCRRFLLSFRAVAWCRILRVTFSDQSRCTCSLRN